MIKLPTAIVGLGLTGHSILRLLLDLGTPRDQIFTFDSKDSSADFQDPLLLLKQNPESLIVSPGVPLSLGWIQDFKKSGGQITSELAIATSFLTSEKVVGVTGSIGKSTCTALLQAGLGKFSPHSFVGGNLGFPLADYVLKKRQTGVTAEWVVLELSSYQLENFENLKCAGSLLTYMTPNHLERYPNLQSYYQTKWALVEKTKGPVVMNRNGGDLFSFAEKKPGPWIWAQASDAEFSKTDFTKAQLVGAHNADNLALVMTLAKHLKWPASAVEGFFEFAGLPHRLENLGLHNGIRFINDSKATTIESVLQAVRSTDSLVKGTLHLLLGGKDKNLPWADLSSINSPKRRFYFFGEVRSAAQQLSGLPGQTYETLGPGIDAALRNAKTGDVVLLSPGGTSFDEFKSFEGRGDFFKNRILKRE